MPHPDDLVLCDAQAATGVGLVIGFAERQRYAAGSGVNRNGYSKKFKARFRLRDTTNGATATVKIQESDDNSSYTDLYSFSLSIPSGSTTNSHAKLFSTKKKYIRANVTALSGGSAPVVEGYLTLGAFGV